MHLSSRGSPGGLWESTGSICRWYQSSTVPMPAVSWGRAGGSQHWEAYASLRLMRPCGLEDIRNSYFCWFPFSPIIVSRIPRTQGGLSDGWRRMILYNLLQAKYSFSHSCGRPCSTTKGRRTPTGNGDALGIELGVDRHVGWWTGCNHNPCPWGGNPLENQPIYHESQHQLAEVAWISWSNHFPPSSLNLSLTW